MQCKYTGIHKDISSDCHELGSTVAQRSLIDSLGGVVCCTFSIYFASG